MCRILSTTHTCGHTSTPSPVICPIYHTYYHGSVLSLASSLIPSAYECPFAIRRESYALSECEVCALDDGVCETDTDASSEPETETASLCCDSPRSYLDATSLKLLEGEDEPLLQHRQVLVDPKMGMGLVMEEGMRKVAEWQGWTRLRGWQRKVRRGGFGGEKVRRKVVRSAISEWTVG